MLPFNVRRSALTCRRSNHSHAWKSVNSKNSVVAVYSNSKELPSSFQLNYVGQQLAFVWHDLFSLSSDQICEQKLLIYGLCTSKGTNATYIVHRTLQFMVRWRRSAVACATEIHIFKKKEKYFIHESERKIEPKRFRVASEKSAKSELHSACALWITWNEKCTFGERNYASERKTREIMISFFSTNSFTASRQKTAFLIQTHSAHFYLSSYILLASLCSLCFN